MKLAPCLLIVPAAAAFGQPPSNAVQPDRLIQHAVDGTVRATLDPSKPNTDFLRSKPLNTVASASSACAVPLLEMQTPKGTDFTIRRVRPAIQDDMPAAQTLPACPAL